MKLCGEPACRVCAAIQGRPVPGPKHSRGAGTAKHHPLDTEHALSRAAEIHCFMLGYQAERGMPPTHREIAAAVGFKNQRGSLVAHYVAKLADRGLVVRCDATKIGRWWGRYWEAVPA